MSLEELQKLREEIRVVTLDIFRLTGERMKLSRRIGEVKRTLCIEIEAPEVEDSLRGEVLEECLRAGMSKDLALGMLDLILEESVRVQKG